MRLDQLPEQQGRARHGPLKSLVVDPEQPEARAEPFDPLEVIQQRPVILAADIETPLDSLGHLP